MDTVLRGLTVYIVLLVILRLSGRRSLSQITAFDFVLLLIIAETTQQALLGDDFSVTNAVILIVTLFLVDVLFNIAKRRAGLISLLIDGAPTVLMSRGALRHDALRRSRVTVEEILKSAREQHGLERLSQIRAAVLETDGKVSIIPKPAGDDSDG